ncbi:MAG: hypothetical protein LKF53_07915 [Solobacterium sp.]|nr:hypothetical protein [Solobacterium sp.]MCH4206301.1 hypothetical protein [Solobacterium sp.]MCH4227767.1 hypothetical protein [Solobacterium sp.]MCH4283190.1 hypothetical protein [Solobacterium sp.]
MDLILCLLLFIAGMFFFALLSKKWGYRVGVGMARKHMKDMGLTDEDQKKEKK